MPLTLDDPIRRYIDPERRNLIIAATGSGETKSIIRYLEDAFKLDVPVVLITANVGSKAYTDGRRVRQRLRVRDPDADRARTART